MCLQGGGLSIIALGIQQVQEFGSLFVQVLNPARGRRFVPEAT